MKDPTATKLANLRPWQPGQSGNPLGRRSDKSLVDHVLASTKGGAELGDLLLNIARNGKRDTDRIEAANALLDRCFGKIAPADRDSLLGALTGVRGEVQFRASFGPRDAARGGVDGAIVETEAQRVDADPAESDAPDAETPVESPE
jgi:hypothetical protein